MGRPRGRDLDDGFEFKRASAPTATRSMLVAVTDLELDSLDVIYPGTDTYPLAPKIRAVPLVHVLDDATYRAFDTLAEYRAWCERELPSWLGYGK